MIRIGTGERLSIEDVVRVARHGEQVELDRKSVV